MPFNDELFLQSRYLFCGQFLLRSSVKSHFSRKPKSRLVHYLCLKETRRCSYLTVISTSLHFSSQELKVVFTGAGRKRLVDDTRPRLGPCTARNKTAVLGRTVNNSGTRCLFVGSGTCPTPKGDILCLYPSKLVWSLQTPSECPSFLNSLPRTVTV